MRKLSVFNFITLNGFFKGPDGDLSWHKQGEHGEEESEFTAAGIASESVLLFGRITYEMMAGYWPSPDALRNDPNTAQGMNKAEKIVFSTTLKKAEWNNTKLIKGDIIDEIKKLKQTPGKDLTVLGSGTIITQFAEHGLIDEYQFMMDPVVIGEGTPIFQGIVNAPKLKLTSSKAFKSGVMLLGYKSIK
jgi:dihydrofolate reductase